ncbi:MAG: hypothetical protein Q4D44_02525 [Eubacteriales bacterium]|nr:hypothetical protein [Eubacteriales bacterium]
MSTMKKVAKILNIISMVCCFWLILPIIFGLRVNKKINNGEELTTADKVLDLLFVNALAGILLFVDKD